MFCDRTVSLWYICQTNGYFKRCHLMGEQFLCIFRVLLCIIVCICVNRSVACPILCPCGCAPPTVCEHGTPPVLMFLWWSVYVSYIWVFTSAMSLFQFCLCCHSIQHCFGGEKNKTGNAAFLFHSSQKPVMMSQSSIHFIPLISTQPTPLMPPRFFKLYNTRKTRQLAFHRRLSCGWRFTSVTNEKQPRCDFRGV